MKRETGGETVICQSGELRQSSIWWDFDAPGCHGTQIPFLLQTFVRCKSKCVLKGASKGQTHRDKRRKIHDLTRE